MKEIDLTRFERNPFLLNGTEVFLVVKSLDQTIRRERLIESLRQPGQKFGRLNEREISQGLLVKTVLRDESVTVSATEKSFARSYREPRGFFQASNEQHYLTDVNSIMLLDRQGEILKRFRHPYFSYLHTLSFNSERNSLLTVSSGYDAIFEVSLTSGQVSWEWFGWDHGFNPRADGVYLTHNVNDHSELQAKGLQSEYIDPSVLGEKGLFTGKRIMHPNSACYIDSTSILVTYGFQGILAKIDLESGIFENKLEVGHPMPHGIFKMEHGWGITNTLRGEFWSLDPDYQIREKIIFRDLPEKFVGLGNNEWLQTTVELKPGLLLALDANRGLIGVDTKSRQYCILKTDANWCIQDAALVRSNF